jgi:hypothetical protein
MEVRFAVDHRRSALDQVRVAGRGRHREPDLTAPVPFGALLVKQLGMVACLAPDQRDPGPQRAPGDLADDALKPWQHRSWIFPRDPHFALKASRVLDLYQREWEGQPLADDEYVLSADEKPGVQARMRSHLPLPPGPGRAMRAESEYHRCGTLAYLAAYDVHRAQVMGRCEPTTASGRSPRSRTR